MDDEEYATAANDQNLDTFEFEGNHLRPAAPHIRRWRITIVALTILLLLALTLALSAHNEHTTGASSASRSAHSGGQATLGSVTPTSSALSSAATTPPASLLAPVPSSCQANPTTLEQISYYATPAYGSFPVWLSGLSPAQNSRVVHFEKYPPLPYTSQGWRWRILLVSMPGYSGLVTLTGEELGGSTGNKSLSLDVGAGVTSLLALDPHRPVMNGLGWAEWPIYVYLPSAGCYEMTAHWPGGSWIITFAAGI